MQKWEKLLLISLFILAILGGLIGFIMNKSGIGDIKVLINLDIFSLLELILLIIVVGCTTFDVYETYKSKKQFGNIKFNITLNVRNKLRTILFCLIFISFFEFILFLISIDLYMLPLFFITLSLILIFIFHNKINNGINDYGILHWGIFHNWEDVKSYNIENDKLLKIKITNSILGFEYNNILKFDFDINQRTDIEKFLTRKLNA